MKTFNHHYTNPLQLEEYIRSEGIQDTKQLLIQLFIGESNKAHIIALQKLFRETFPLSRLIGTTTDGAIIDGKVTQAIQVIISFTIFETTELSEILIEHGSFDYNPYETGKAIAQRLVKEDTKLIITFSDGINTNGEEYLKGIYEISPDITVAGGMAGDNGELKNTYVFTKDQITNNGVVGLALHNRDLHITTDYSFNWTPIGKHLTVTKSVKNQIFEIDGLSAVDIYEKYMGKELAMRLPQIGIEFPLILERDGVLVGRAVLDKKDDGSLIFAGNIHENEQVRFGIGNIEMILRDSQYHARRLSQYPIESIFIYSCMARRRFMGPRYIELELEPLQEIATTSGFFTYGEFFQTQHSAQLLNETMTILALSESQNAIVTSKNKSITLDQHFGINPLHVISHLANTVAKEFEQLNGDLELRIQENTAYILEQVYTDRLTRLPNRLRLIEDLPAFKGAYLILININDFTALNDFYGHQAGDAVLEEFAQTLIRLSKEEELQVYKLPADEYAIISKSSEIKDKIAHLFNLLNNFIYQFDQNHIHVNITMAATYIFGDGLALANVDMTLKHAKRQSEDYLIFQKNMMLSELYKDNLDMANMIRHALKAKSIVPYFQPIINVKSGLVERYECLARLIGPNGEVKTPMHFLQRSQKIRLYFEITKDIIIKSFEKFHHSGIKFSINLSIDDILHPNIRDFIFEHIKRYEIGKQLTFEILETQELENDHIILNFINQAKALGVTFAVDDFGSGFANFQHITRINLDMMKIDGSLIRIMHKDKNARVVVETLVDFAKKLGLLTVAEYVECHEIYAIVKELGIDYAQGYLLGRPQADIASL